MMETLNDFLIAHRKIEVLEPYVVISQNITGKIYEFIADLRNISFTSDKYYKYCGDVKRVFQAFLSFWGDVIADCLTDKCMLMDILDKKLFINIIERSAHIQLQKQTLFKEYFVPKNKKETEQFKEIEELYEKHLVGLEEMKLRVIAFDTDAALETLYSYHCDLSIKKKHECFLCTHTMMALNLSRQTMKIKISLDEILTRVNTNHKKLLDKNNIRISALMVELYDTNKEYLELYRRYEDKVVQKAETVAKIKKLQHQIETSSDKLPIKKVETELEYWNGRYKGFLEIKKHVDDLWDRYDELTKFKKVYEERNEYPPFNMRCWEDLGDKLQQRGKYLEERLIYASKALVTFFTVRGDDRVEYKDHFGHYNIDEYGHKIYIVENENKKMHLDCEGNFKQISSTRNNQYDENGTYFFNEKGEKIYQVGPCTSLYNLRDEILVKITKDCGHSEFANPKCAMQIRDPNSLLFLPKSKPVDVKGTITKEMAEYVWNSLGHYLPEALVNLYERKHATNPIPLLGHNLLVQRYMKYSDISVLETAKELSQLCKKKRTEKQLQMFNANRCAWKAKLPKRFPPEETEYLVMANQALLARKIGETNNF